jgi:chemotaxis receptor (MCP) glutamine deamidase CheD
MFNTQTGQAGMRSVILPAQHDGSSQEMALIADAALDDLFNKIGSGAGAEAIQVKLFGGADLSRTSISFSDGAMTLSFTRRWLQNRTLAAVAQSVGGNQRREIVFFPKSGRVFCKKIELDEAFIETERNSVAHRHEVHQRVELF